MSGSAVPHNIAITEIAALGRLPAASVAALSTEQLAALASIVGEGGRVAPPYRYLLASPKVMQNLAKMGADLRASSDLTVREREIAVLVTATHFGSEFVRTAHYRDAKAIGLPVEALDAIVAGQTPAFSDKREQEVYELTAALHRSNPVPADQAADFERVLGRKLVADVLGYIGCYAVTCYVMRMVDAKASDVGPLPPGLARLAAAREK